MCFLLKTPVYGDYRELSVHFSMEAMVRGDHTYSESMWTTAFEKSCHATGMSCVYVCMHDDVLSFLNSSLTVVRCIAIDKVPWVVGVFALAESIDVK